MFDFLSIDKNTQKLLFSTILIISLPLSAEDKIESEFKELMELSLEELLNVRISVASNFKETQLETSASSEVISKAQWQQLGANTIFDAIGHLPSIMTHDVPWGGTGIAIRGYSSPASVSGIAVSLDGVPLNNIFTGSALYEARSLSLQSLNRIELIRGPGSSLYGSDAFHGVLSLHSYESGKDQSILRTKWNSEGVKQLSFNHSKDFGNGYKFNASFSGADQPKQDIPFSFTDPATSETIISDRDNNYDSYMGILKLKVEHTDKFSSSYGIYVLGSDTFEGVGPGQSQSPFGSVLGEQDKTVGSEDRVIVKIDFNLALDNDYELDGKSYYWRLERDAITDVTALGLAGINAIQKQDERGIDITLKQTKNDWNTQWAVGVGYEKAKLVDSSVALVIGLTNERLTPLAEQQESGFNRDVTSLFFETKTKLIDEQLTLQTGARIDRYKGFGNQTSPHLGLVYSTDESSAIKLVYGEAFKAPTAGEISGGAQRMPILIYDLKKLKPQSLFT
ncbi:MAG: TonB-dependent receptor [Kangiellaceae bacterium]|nr:TonB-dependent receptor [Kangiellaceae bacterium]